jgi:transcriptional regulator with XRE-family HTH domain
VKKDLTRRYQALQSLLEETRRKAGMSQKDVADALGVHQTFVSKVEKGERRLDVVEFMELAEALGVDPIKLIRRLNSTDTT